MDEKNKAIQEALRGLLSTPPRKRSDGIGEKIDAYRSEIIAAVKAGHRPGTIARVISNCGLHVPQSTMARYIERLKKKEGVEI